MKRQEAGKESKAKRLDRKSNDGKQTPVRAILTEQSATIPVSRAPIDECLTAIPPAIDVAALAKLYNSPPVSNIAHEYLLEQARRAMMKYELAQADLEIAADSLARAMHFLIEQHGEENLSPKQMAELERDVLEWYGLCQPSVPISKMPKPKAIANSVSAPAAEKHSKRKTMLSHQKHVTHLPAKSHGTATAH